MYFDSHTHFDLILENHDMSETDVLNVMKNNNISGAVQISIDADGFQWSYDFAKRNKKSGILFSIGIHPSSFADEKKLIHMDNFLQKIMTSENKDLLFGIGECGLDFFRMRQKKEMQINSFEFQIDIAKKLDLPIIVHSREAMENTIEILKSHNVNNGIMHCFPGNRQAAKQALDLGFYISFAGNVTYKNAFDLHESARYVPLDRILLETDAPFLTPVPKRGKKNRPDYIMHTYTFVSELKKIDKELLVQSVYNNITTIKNYKSGV